ncbi:MAG: phytanoyl-CoA dioxygenase family protein [Chloroflexota bacterium]
MPQHLEPIIADPDDIVAQIDCFKAHSYVILPKLLSDDEVVQFNEAIDRDRQANNFLWQRRTNTAMEDTHNLLLSEPIFELVINRPQVLGLLQALLGAPACFEQLTVSHRDGEPNAVETNWHRDTKHWFEHNLNLDYPQVIYYLTDVDKTTHCFTVSPERAGGSVLMDAEAQLTQSGLFHFYGKAGTAILFNSAILHGVTLRKTGKIRRTIQLYYGHPNRPSLSDLSLKPPRLWRDHPDADIRHLYGKMNRFTNVVLRNFD